MMNKLVQEYKRSWVAMVEASKADIMKVAKEQLAEDTKSRGRGYDYDATFTYAIDGVLVNVYVYSFAYKEFTVTITPIEEILGEHMWDIKYDTDDSGERK